MKNATINFKAITCILLFAFSSITFGYSQDTISRQKSEFWKKVRFGGGIGLGTSNGFFSATLAPTAIYQFNNKAGLGLGLNGTYTRRKNISKSTILGGSIIALYNPIQQIQLSSEFEQLNVNRELENSQIDEPDYWYSALFLGAGYRTGTITFGIRYDVLYDEARSIYAEPWLPFVRVFF